MLFIIYSYLKSNCSFYEITRWITRNSEIVVAFFVYVNVYKNYLFSKCLKNSFIWYYLYRYNFKRISRILMYICQIIISSSTAFWSLMFYALCPMPHICRIQTNLIITHLSKICPIVRAINLVRINTNMTFVDKKINLFYFVYPH